MLRKICLIFFLSTKGTKSKIRSCLLLSCSKFSMLTLSSLTGCNSVSLSLCFNPVHTCSELFPWAQKASTETILAVWGEGDQVLAHSRTHCSCLAQPVEWVVEVIKKKGGAQEFWAGCEIAEQSSQRLGNPLQASSKVIWGLGSHKASLTHSCRGGSHCTEGLAETHHLHKKPILCSLEPGSKSSFLFPFPPAMGHSHFPHRVHVSQTLLKTWFPLIFMFPCSETSLLSLFAHLVPLSLSPPRPWGCTRAQSVFCICHEEITVYYSSGLKVALGDALMPGGELGPSAGACTELSLTQAGKVQKIPLLEWGQWPQESAQVTQRLFQHFPGTQREKNSSCHNNFIFQLRNTCIDPATSQRTWTGSWVTSHGWHVPQGNSTAAFSGSENLSADLKQVSLSVGKGLQTEEGGLIINI